jgi:hypothetical protein
VWQRPAQPVGRERQRKPIAEKESDCWLEGYALACEVKQACPQTVVVHVADQEGEIHEWFLDAMRRPAGERTAFLIRAKCNRRIAKGPRQSHLWAELQETHPLGTMTVELARTPDRVPRQVTLSVAVQRVLFNQARRLGGSCRRSPPPLSMPRSASHPRARSRLNGCCSRACL